jgi:hypothetical protein
MQKTEPKPNANAVHSSRNPARLVLLARAVQLVRLGLFRAATKRAATRSGWVSRDSEPRGTNSDGSVAKRDAAVSDNRMVPCLARIRCVARPAADRRLKNRCPQYNWASVCVSLPARPGVEVHDGEHPRPSWWCRTTVLSAGRHVLHDLRLAAHAMTITDAHHLIRPRAAIRSRSMFATACTTSA